MTRHRCAAAVFVFLLALSSSATAEEQGRTAPVQSFTALQPLLTPGERLIVRDGSGKKTSGRFVSLSGDELVIRRRRWNFRTEHRTWTEGGVRQVQHRDSTWNGGAIGAAAGVAAIVVMAKSPGCDLRCLPLAGAAVPVGLLIGDAIDGSINLTLYESPGVTRRNLAPALRNASTTGVALSYRFSLGRSQ